VLPKKRTDREVRMSWSESKGKKGWGGLKRGSCMSREISWGNVLEEVNP